ncbi:hypothetical protein [Commensalibacter nepenthis]|uniref:Uncharacterized protein n=1 Tax=Commensalibacter nepenthis TaxID=3043872 RepID=A0ABT6QAI5_9PROT|nr:hypothetical protein [Commensalibacter sp. TBRC 10068]MDI2113921.1 hypothetical protein [Commensalibacter sp. TBRC 10068]
MNDKIPNDETLETFAKTDRGEDVYLVKDLTDLLQRIKDGKEDVLSDEDVRKDLDLED